MEEIILQNLGNISLAGALVVITFILRPVLMQREENSSKRDERDHELALKRADVDRQTATVLTSLKASLDAGQPIARMQLETMERLAEKVEKMTEDNSKGLDRIKTQIDELPEEVWKTGDPRLAALVDKLQLCVSKASKEAEIIELLQRILARLEQGEDKPEEA